MASFIYDNYLKEEMGGVFDLDSHTLKVALLTSSYTPNQNSHTTYSDLTNEVSGTGYTAGGATLAGAALTVSAGTAKFDANDTVWSSASITARYAVIYDTSASNKLICLVDFGSDKTSSAADFTIQWSASGIFTKANA